MGYTDPDRSEEKFGWYVSPTGTCAGGEGWKRWRHEGTYAGAYCCYSELFGQPDGTTSTSETTTTSTTTTTRPTTSPTTMPTWAPQTTSAFDPMDNLPSSLSQPEGCTDTGFTISGFPQVNFCSSNGVVYLNGRSTCVPSDGSQSEMFNALQTVWEDEWYLAADGCTADKTYEEATNDQLWITNEVCNNLQKDIVELESTISDYSASWSQTVLDLVNEQLDGFDSETQQALEDYLATLQ